MKKSIFVFLLLCTSVSMMAQYDFTAVAPSGQTLYYRFSWYDTSAVVTYSSYEVPNQSDLSGNLIIPDSVYWSDQMMSLPVRAIDSGCFRSTSITSVTIPVTMRIISHSAFANCTSMTTINYNADSCGVGWPSEWNDADPNAGIFEGCTNVTTINIGNATRYVPPFIFYECAGLQTLTVGRSVIRFHCDALPYEPNNMTTLNFNAATCAFRHGGYSGEYYYNYWIGNGVQRYYKELSPFEDIASLTNVNLGNGVVGLYRHFFNGCTGLTSVVVPDSVTYMRDCFEYCTNLQTVTIGSSVEDMHGAFNGCSHLTTINVRAEYPPTCDAETFEDVPAYADIIVPCGTAYRYQLTDYWSAFSRIIEDCDGMEEVMDNSIRVWSYNGRVYTDVEAGISVQIFDVNGRLVSNENLGRGIYIVKVGESQARKVVVIK